MASHNAVADFRFWSHVLVWLVQPLSAVAEEHLRAHASDQSIWFSPPGSWPSLVVGPFDVEKLWPNSARRASTLRDYGSTGTE